MITVTAGGPIVTGIDGDTRRTFDADTVIFRCELSSTTGHTDTFISFIDVDDEELISFRGPEIEEADLTIASESTTNPCTIYLREVEKIIKDYLETANGGATFTIS